MKTYISFVLDCGKTTLKDMHTIAFHEGLVLDHHKGNMETKKMF